MSVMVGHTLNDSGIDKGLSLLLLGIVVIGFILTLMAGMQEVEETSQEVREKNVATEAPPQFDFAD